MLPLFSTPGISATTSNVSLVLVLFQLFPLFRFLGCVKDRCNEVRAVCDHLSRSSSVFHWV
jgi:hypothetical protein